MKKIILCSITMIFVLSLFSCSNLFPKSENQTSSLSFSIPTSMLARTVTNDTEQLKVICNLTGAVEAEKTVILPANATEAKFDFSDVPLNKKLNISVDVWKLLPKTYTYNNHSKTKEFEYLLAQGTSSTTLKNPSNNTVNLTLDNIGKDFPCTYGWKVSGKKQTFTVGDHVPRNAKTLMTLYYPRTGQGAQDEIEFSDVNLEIKKTDSAGKVEIAEIPKYLYMDLVVSGNPATGETFEDESLVYFCDIPLNFETINPGDEISVELKSAYVTGHGVDDNAQQINLFDIIYHLTYYGVDDSADNIISVLYDWDEIVPPTEVQELDWSLEQLRFPSLITKAELREVWDENIREKDYAVANNKCTTITPFMPEYSIGITKQPEPNGKVAIRLCYDRLSHGEKALTRIEDATVYLTKIPVTGGATTGEKVSRILNDQSIVFATNKSGSRIDIDPEQSSIHFPKWGRMYIDPASRKEYVAEIDITDLNVQQGDTVCIEIVGGTLYFEDKEIDINDDGRGLRAVVVQVNPWQEISDYCWGMEMFPGQLKALYKLIEDEDRVDQPAFVYMAFIANEFFGLQPNPDEPKLYNIVANLNNPDYNLKCAYSGNPAVDGTIIMTLNADEVGYLIENGKIEGFEDYERIFPR